MMTSSRPRADVGGSFASRRGHASQLSISDPSHHVTETIGTLYGDEEDYSNDQRPMSFLGPSYSDQLNKQGEADPSADPSAEDPRRQMIRSATDKTGLGAVQNGTPALKKSQTLPTRSPSQRSNSYENGPKSPPMSLRDVKNESSQFPLGSIENPNDIAQELSNLQALRRMSMDVGNNADPDMLPFSGLSLVAMPPIAPTGDDDENDPSRLLWVPAAVHPELAPTEFKNFLEDRVKTIRRRSGDSNNSGMDRSDSGGGLRRKKSMLSRQIDNSGGRGAVGYVDGAERLGRKSSLRDYSTPELNLNELVKDPTKVVRELSQESQAEGAVEDMPILPVAPGMGLRRSTRTTYRKNGSVRSGDRLPFSKRVANRHTPTDSSDSADTVPPLPSDVPEVPPLPSHQRVQSEPVAENFSRPNRSVRRQHKFSQDMGTSSDGASSEVEEPVSPLSSRPEQQHPARTSSVSADAKQAVPSIVESPTTEENGQRQQFPQRSSSQNASQQVPPKSPVEEPPARSSKRPGSSNSVQSPTTPAAPQQPQVQHAKQPTTAPNHTLNDMASHPSTLPGSGASRTDTLTFIPTLPAEEKKPEEKRAGAKLRKERDDDASSVSSTKSSGGWSKWLKGGSDDKDKKKKDDEKKKKHGAEKVQDNARLDVLQNSIEGASSKGRESIVVDRDNVDNKLAEERKKESKKTESKKEKEGGLFSGLFGGGKKKSEKESSSKKNQHLRVSEDVPYRPLKPDVDYHWTRFPLLEERAIYRMAHIKLANPRRSLLSQVLLSNFMYNYLAIVQAMHPQMQVPQSPQQRRLEEERRRKEQEEQYLAQQQQQQDAADQDTTGQYNFEYHRGESQYGDHPHDEVDYVDDAQIYEYDHGGDIDNGRSNGYNGPDSYDAQPGKQYYHDQYGRDGGDNARRRDDREDMW
ncbi:protein zds1 [Colletotrichum liriopes]|uniref:Protein zds1 n=1 Tax=Colletotrichum liriopes TaxID=708192 RepID=A0AA37LWV5_9PEZI|nr:protein zds1 [Colletotrichum liriopes]